jgi:4'-phosphopantetheinyl transferase EntD
MVSTTRAARRLTAGEQAILARLKAPARRESWLRGRAALKKLLGKDFDSAALRFPQPEISLTHAGDVAVAVHCKGARGLGVDLEIRPPSERAARRVLSPAEFAAAQGPDGWLLFWTIKEACFKADLANQGRTLLDYPVHDPRFHHASTRAYGGWLTVAVARPAKPR